MPEAQQTVVDPVGTQAPPAGGTVVPPAGGTVTPPPAKPKEEPTVVVKPKEEPAGGAAPSKAKKLGLDEEPEDNEEYTLKSADFKRRIERERKKLLKELHGTDDEAAIRERLAKVKEIETKQEEARRLELSEQERLKEDAKKEKTRADLADARVKELEEQREIDAENHRISAFVGTYVKPKYAKHAVADFSDYLLKELTPKQQDAMKDEDIAKWFEDYAKDNPELAVVAGEGAPPVLPRVPAANGHKGNVKPAPLPSGSMDSTKTAAPGKPNSMTPAEYREFKKTKGLA